MDIVYKTCDPLSVDYYGILELCRDCTPEKIRKAFRRLAINLHPARDEGACPCDLAAEERQTRFALVAEAYDVLSKPALKAVYDEFGPKVLKQGLNGPASRIKPYVYHGEPLRTYREFFGTDNPHADLLDNLIVPPEENTTVIPKKKGAAVIEPLELTLSEIFFGGIKKICYDNKMLSISIMPGLPAYTRIVFPDMIDHGPAKEKGDLVLVTNDKDDPNFVRDGADLIMSVYLSLKEALIGTTITVNTIDDRTLHIPITSVVSPRERKVIVDEGLPLVEDPSRRGNLVLAFEIVFPDRLTAAGKRYIAMAFDAELEEQKKADTRDKSHFRRMVMDGKVYERASAANKLAGVRTR